MTATPNYGSKVDTFNSLFKNVYADNLNNLVPEDTKLLKLIGFDNAVRLGKKFEQAVNLNYSGGFTFAGTDDMFALNDAQSAKLATATLDANEMLLRDQISYKALSASEGGGAKAFADATKHIVRTMNVAFARALEAQLMYGSAGLGTVESATAFQVVITAATWADGLWIGCEGSRLIQAYNGSTLRVVTGGTNVGSDGTKALRVTAVDPSTRTLTVDITQASNLTAAGDVLYIAGAKGREMMGLHAILTEATSLFGIAPSTSTLWKGNSIAVGSAALTVSKVTKGLAALIGKGLVGENIKLICGVRSFDDLIADVISKRAIDSSYDAAEFKQGTQGCRIYFQGGIIEVVPSVYCKEGNAYAINPDDFSRIGSRDKSFTMPGEDGQFFRQVPNSAAWEMRIYTDQALFCRAPGRQAVFTGIVPTA